jgi:hypothetical protein
VHYVIRMGAELKREAARQGRTMSELVETALRLLLRSQPKRAKVPVLHVQFSRIQLSRRRYPLSGDGRDQRADVSQWRHTSKYCRPRRPLPGHGRSLVLVVDTNVLVYVADADSQFHAPCRE